MAHGWKHTGWGHLQDETGETWGEHGGNSPTVSTCTLTFQQVKKNIKDVCEEIGRLADGLRFTRT